MVAIDQDELDAISELQNMTAAELDNVEYALKKWCCQAKNCTNGTTVRDYGISPLFYRPGRRSEWYDLTTNYWMCGKHNKFIKRLAKSFGMEKTIARILDWKNPPLKKLLDITHKPNNKIDWSKDDIDK